MGGGVRRFLFDRRLEEGDGLSQAGVGPLVPVDAALQVQRVGRGIDTGMRGRRTGLDAPQPLGNPLRDVLLHGENIVHGTIVRFGPEMKAIRRIDELGRDPELFSRSPNAPLQDRGHVQRGGHRADVLLSTLEGER